MSSTFKLVEQLINGVPKSFSDAWKTYQEILSLLSTKNIERNAFNKSLKSSNRQAINDFVKAKNLYVLYALINSSSFEREIQKLCNVFKESESKVRPAVISYLQTFTQELCGREDMFSISETGKVSSVHIVDPHDIQSIHEILSKSKTTEKDKDKKTKTSGKNITGNDVIPEIVTVEQKDKKVKVKKEKKENSDIAKEGLVESKNSLNTELNKRKNK